MNQTNDLQAELAALRAENTRLQMQANTTPAGTRVRAPREVSLKG